MSLTTLALVRQVPGLQNVVKATDAWLNTLIGAADVTIKRWCKQHLELNCYTEYYDGNEHPELVLFQYPVWTGTTQIAAGSDGVQLPTSTINVASTLNPDGTAAFDPAGRSGAPPSIAVQTSLNSWTQVFYTGITITEPYQFTGCTGGIGTLSATNGLNSVSQPLVWIDSVGYAGQAQPGTMLGLQSTGPFAPGTMQVQGVNFMTAVDQYYKSKRGLLQKIGGYGPVGFIGSYPPGGWGGYRDKLAGWRLPCWPRGTKNIRVAYSAGYETVPDDLQYAATTLVARMVKDQPRGIEMSSENLGGWSYSVLQSNEPDLANLRQILSRYREVSW